MRLHVWARVRMMRAWAYVWLRVPARVWLCVRTRVWARVQLRVFSPYECHGLCRHRPGHSLGKNTRSCTRAHSRVRTRSHTRAGTRGHTYAHARIIRTCAHTRKHVYGCV